MLIRLMTASCKIQIRRTNQLGTKNQMRLQLTKRNVTKEIRNRAHDIDKWIEAKELHEEKKMREGKRKIGRSEEVKNRGRKGEREKKRIQVEMR